MISMNTITENPISCAIARAGGVRQLAIQLGVTHPAILRWRDLWDAGEPESIPPRRAIAIEAATGVPRSQLRPDLWGEPAKEA
jgi:DNA-binding transcriptional regulator YdaS (Cro superfamily)